MDGKPVLQDQFDAFGEPLSHTAGSAAGQGARSMRAVGISLFWGLAVSIVVARGIFVSPFADQAFAAAKSVLALAGH